MKKDITTRNDVERLVDGFYARVQTDDLIGRFFNEIVGIDWDTHLPVMYQFWSTMLLGEHSYRGNPLVKHMAVDAKEQLTEAHFDRWISLWEATVDANFSGSKADEAKFKANRVKLMMLPRIESERPTQGFSCPISNREPSS